MQRALEPIAETKDGQNFFTFLFLSKITKFSGGVYFSKFPRRLCKLGTGQVNVSTKLII